METPRVPRPGRTSEPVHTVEPIDSESIDAVEGPDTGAAIAILVGAFGPVRWLDRPAPATPGETRRYRRHRAA